MKSWSEKMHGAKAPHTKRLEKSGAGMSAGALMLISTPIDIDSFINQIPYGQTISVAQMRDALAKQHKADCTCPLTTGIFLRIVAEAAFEKLNTTPNEKITPFWRVIDANSSTAKKLSFDNNFIQQKRSAEGID